MKIKSKERDNEQPICIVQILHNESTKDQDWIVQILQNESTKDQDSTFYPCGFEIGNLNH